jgi:Polyketide cyclase / dehydrase and lipid transport
MLMPILIAIAAIIVVFVIVVAMRPDDFRVTRTATMSAPPAMVFAQVNDFHKWEAWSPWAKLDPACKNSYEGSAAGTGAIFSWSGNNKVGEGRMTTLESRSNNLIRIKIQFLRPFKAINTAEFTFQAQGNQTVVRWDMFGKNNFMSKAFGLFVNFDKLVGGDFEKGLASLKSIAETAVKS